MSMVFEEVTGQATGEAKCDECGTLAPAPGDWLAEHPGERWPGWMNMGWYCSGGRHLCPAHNPTEK